MRSYLVTVRSRAASTQERLYLLAGALQPAEVERLVAELLHDPVAQTAAWQELSSDLTVPNGALVEIAFRPGVTDNEAETIRIGAHHIGITALQQAKTLRRIYVSQFNDLAALRAHANDRLLNDLIETAYVALEPNSAEQLAFYHHLLHMPAPHTPAITHVPLRAAADDELQRISRTGILALSLAEMRSIQEYFTSENRDPTDGELETIAQTWSEHCRHKTFRALIRYQGSGIGDRDDRYGGASVPAAPTDHRHYPALAELAAPGGAVIDGLLKHYLMRATEAVRDDALLSAFVDNAGIVAFDDDFEVSFKVETHNHPSALEPFGGANTGVGGVVRDVLGVSAKPIALTDVLCFGPSDLPEAQLSPGVLHPRRIREGVVAGVRDYGNKLGIPNINGAILYDPGYIANPLVFCGTVGLAPRGSHPRGTQPGDAIIVVGGRTGRDGIHGATFSSVELTHDTAETVGAAVQIGDPITEKTVIDVLLQARDLHLYSAITDCGAGGLSSAVGEMGEATGAQVELRDVPLKYTGLQPWEIWISEAQERMVVAVPPANVQPFLDLCQGEDVEATVIGTFTADSKLHVTYNGATLVDLTMNFLHSGGARLELAATWGGEAVRDQGTEIGDRRSGIGDRGSGIGDQLPTTDHRPPTTDHRSVLLAVLGHPIIASKENVVRTYDHEVQGATILKPLVGVREDGPGDAGALQPRLDSRRGIVVGCGINPRYGKLDPYWMALAVVDEALRNVVAAGGDPSQTWILDNFCWGDPKLPDRLGGLVRAAAGCHDAALAFRTPFISGKDSLNNEYRDAEGNRVAIPPTLLISALALVPDVLHTVSMDAKAAGNALYLIGETRAELGGATVGDIVFGADNGQVPQVDLALAPTIHRAVHATIAAGLVRACHDLSEGGLGVAAAEMAFAGELGITLDLQNVPSDRGQGAGDRGQGAVDNRQSAIGKQEALDAVSPTPDPRSPIPTTSDFQLLWSESPTRWLMEVAPENIAQFETTLETAVTADTPYSSENTANVRILPWARVGTITAEPQLVISGMAGDEILRADVMVLKQSWQNHT